MNYSLSGLESLASQRGDAAQVINAVAQTIRFSVSAVETGSVEGIAAQQAMFILDRAAHHAYDIQS